MSFRRAGSARLSNGYQENVSQGDTQDAPSTSASHSPQGMTLESNCPADVSMERIIAKLKLLDYEAAFCRSRRQFKPLSRTYFAFPLRSTDEQFFYFGSLVSWLLGLVGRSLPAPQQYDDPNVVCTNIVLQLRDLGFAVPSYPPAKLKTGWGEAVCGVLTNLLDLVLEKQQFTYKPPVHLPETYVEEVDEGGEDDTADIADEVAAAYSSEDEAYLEPGTAPTQTRGIDAAAKDVGTSEPKVDPAEWRLELERVAPRLKIAVQGDAKDWRAHLEEAHRHAADISAAWPDGRTVFSKLQAEVAGALEKLAVRERFLNSQLEDEAAEFRQARQELTALQQQYTSKQDAISQLDDELAHLTKKLEDKKRELDERGNNVSDTSPVVQLKAAIKGLRKELSQMQVRVGVAQHQLLQISLAHRRRLHATIDGDHNAGVEI